MALLKFNYGLLKDLPAAKANGNLYITTDSQGLYVDLDDQRIHISDFIQVESLDALTALGSYSTEVFYYVSGSNALMKYTGIEGAEWKQLNSITSLFTLLHEIGHCENNNSKMRRCEEEFYATQWALDKCKELKINVPDKIVEKYQRYVYRELERGLRRKGYGYPSKEEMTLKKGI